MKYQPNQIYHIYNQGNNKQRIFFRDENYLYFIEKMRKYLLPNVHILCYCLMPNHFHWLVYTKEQACLPSTSVKPRSKFSDDYKSYLNSIAFCDKKKNENQNITSIKSENSLIEHKDFQQNLSKSIGVLLSTYTKAINKQEKRTGSLFRDKTKSKRDFIDELLTVEFDKRKLLMQPDFHYSRICFEYIHENPVKAGIVDEQEDWYYSSAKDYFYSKENSICNLLLWKRITHNENTLLPQTS